MTQHRGTSASRGRGCVVVWRESPSAFPPWALQHEEQCPYIFLSVDLKAPLPCEAAVLGFPHPGLCMSFWSQGCSSVPPLVSPEVTSRDLCAVLAEPTLCLPRDWLLQLLPHIWEMILISQESLGWSGP